MKNLKFYYGPMGTAKTNRLQSDRKHYEVKGYETIVVKPKEDTKGGDKIVTRLGLSMGVDIIISKGESFLSRKNKYIWQSSHAVFVDEAEMLKPKQIDELAEIAFGYGIDVNCYGLLTNFKGELWKGAKRLMEVASELIPLYGVCQHGNPACNNPSTHTYRKINGVYVADGPELIIDGTDENIEYGSICASCYHKYVRSKQKVKK